MRKFLMVGALGGIILANSLAQAEAGSRFRERMRERFAERAAAAEHGAPAIAKARTIAYGADPLQVLDFWPAAGPSARTGTAAPAPLVIFVHGGGWKRGSKDDATGKWKPGHYPAQGYAFASINYRLVPQATVEQQAADVSAAVKTLIAQADQLHIDRRRIVLMGHSAGAHLVALVGTDEQYLRGAGLSFADIAGIIPIDGAAYDVPTQMTSGPAMMKQTYQQAFGTEPGRQRALSPTLQATAPNAPAFLLLYVQRDDGVKQTQALAAALKAGGTSADEGSFPGTGLMGHMEINRRLGDPAYPPTATVDTWLRRVFSR